MAIPQQIGPYRILARLGAGGMAEVFLAEAYGASGFCKRVAIKILLPEMQERPEIVKALIAEARLGAQLQHRNLVQIHDLGVADGRYYLRMDYLDAGSLSGVPSLPLPVALYVAEELATGLHYLHQACDEAQRPLGLVHRDVSPSNVLLSSSGEVKLSDFGLAKVTSAAEVTRGNVRKGKYAYMSPEQINGEALGPASDQFSFGVVLYELLCGARPFDAQTVHQTMANISGAEVSLEALPRDLQSLVARCLKKTPTARYLSMMELLDDLVLARRNHPAASPQTLAQAIAKTP